MKYYSFYNIPLSKQCITKFIREIDRESFKLHH